MSYKINVNKEKLEEFLLTEEEFIGGEHLLEVYKVIDIVLHKFRQDCPHLYSEIRSEIFTVLLERRERYEPGKDAYNFIFTMCRNESGNVKWRLEKEKYTDDMLVLDSGSVEMKLDYIPEACRKYIKYLTCEEDFTLKRISRKDAVDIITYLRLKDPNEKRHEVPDYVLDSKSNLNVLFKLIKDLIEIS